MNFSGIRPRDDCEGRRFGRASGVIQPAKVSFAKRQAVLPGRAKRRVAGGTNKWMLRGVLVHKGVEAVLSLDKGTDATDSENMPKPLLVLSIA